MLQVSNHLIRNIERTYESLPPGKNGYMVLISSEKRLSGEHERRYNAPVFNEVANFLVNEEHRK